MELKAFAVLGILAVVLVSGCSSTTIDIPFMEQSPASDECQYNHDCGICDVCIDNQCEPDECYVGTPEQCCIPGKCVCPSGSPEFVDRRYCNCI
jgi:hypothetical protein